MNRLNSLMVAQSIGVVVAGVAAWAFDWEIIGIGLLIGLFCIPFVFAQVYCCKWNICKISIVAIIIFSLSNLSLFYFYLTSNEARELPLFVAIVWDVSCIASLCYLIFDAPVK